MRPVPPRSDLERLSEGQTLYPVGLTITEAAALNASQLVKAVPDELGWRVTAEYWVGTVARGDLVVRVAPKIGAVQVLRLLAMADGASDLAIDDERVEVADDADLSAVLARMFVLEAERALAAGPLRGYRSEDQTLPVLRGRLRLRDQYLRRFGQLSPLEVTVDEWTIDTAENRLIRSAALALLALPGLTGAVEADLRRVDRMLVEAERLVPGVSTPAWQPTRLNARLHALLGLANLTLRHVSVESTAGEMVVHGFRVNMAHLFERLMARLLADVDPAWSAQVTLPLDHRQTLVIRPDLVRDDGTGWTGVADTKYKILDDAGKVSNADIYQVVTYCARLGLTIGHLIYADGGTPPPVYEVVGTDAAIAVHRIDLTALPGDLRAQVSALAVTLGPTTVTQPCGR
ncbi:McrC family protein [Mumia zhuanghuii]|uniref:Restriction endonuclease n=1 Tax=Mumia zhuanghuii TaxID=2585211 RepID=A0A5C4N8P0_9ACTN|nr:restriction endonuclease [Mumia zhuanghuii]TNC52582.1 restriction endonuclease [Mumia zhuanghuii]TNC52684.1 restriction endonuclease [Mumia zhuanghuii]